MSKSTSESPATEPTSTTPAAPRIKLDESTAKLSYANFFNVSSTREETALLFGMIQASANANEEVVIQVSDRVVMTPLAAKRLEIMLHQVMEQYEARFGSLGEAALR